MKDQTPIYDHSAEYAREHGELEQYRASVRANVACKEAIEQAIRDHYRDNRLGAEAVQQVLSQFACERVVYVLAVTVREKDWDGRFSRDNKAWAQTIPVSLDAQNRHLRFVVDRSHPGLVDLFLTQARREFAKEQEKKPSIRKSMKQNTEQTASGQKPAKHKEPER